MGALSKSRTVEAMAHRTISRFCCKGLHLYYREIVHIRIRPLCLKGSFAFEKDGSFGATCAEFQHLQVGVSVCLLMIMM